MCFNPQVHVAVGTLTTAVAISTLRRNESIGTLPLALIPSIFSLHLFTSAIVWLGLSGELSGGWLHAAKSCYLFIAFVLWPIYLPLALIPIESNRVRRSTLCLLLALGVWVSASYLFAISHGNGTARLEHLFIDFHVNNVSAVAGATYFLTTCGAALISSNQRIFLWGIANLLVTSLLAVSKNHALPSLWCFWAAVLQSVL